MEQKKKKRRIEREGEKSEPPPNVAEERDKWETDKEEVPKFI